jgi:voltage-gated potassium channel
MPANATFDHWPGAGAGMIGTHEPPPHWRRRLRVAWRDTRVLLRQFRVALLALSLAVIGGGALYFMLAQRANLTHPATLAESFFLIMTMIFFQANTEFPRAWYLALFFFIMPIVGLAILSQGVAEFGLLLFNRRARGEAWQLALAETYSNHIVIVGLGHLGFRVASALHNLGENFIGIELDPEADLVSRVQDWDVPIIKGDANKFDILRAARIDQAHTVVIVTSDDTVNLQIAIHARAINPKIRTIVRLFDDDFSREVRLAFGITAAYSASALAAPAFAAAAADVHLGQPLSVGGRTLNVGQFTITQTSALANQPVGEIEKTYDLSVILLRRAEQAQLHPADDHILLVGDQITVMAESSTLHKVNRLNR